jgi:hypothetical protein
MIAPLPLPSWTVGSLQALAYWIGWSHERYPHWPLSEGAMVAEAQALIAARLPDSLVALAETPTKYLVSEDAVDLRSGRVDLLLARRIGGRRPERSELRLAASDLIEVKRGQAPWAEIEKDLVRLACLVKSLPQSCRAFLVVGCEAGHVPSKFVNDGVAIRILGRVSGGIYRTRRVWAASPARSRTSSVHLVVLVEVFSTTA